MLAVQTRSGPSDILCRTPQSTERDPMSLSATNVGTTSRADIGIALVKGEMAGSTRNPVGRRHECEELDEVVARARAGNSPVLVLRGEAGAGKTSLLEHAIRSASDLSVVGAVGIESEMELAYAALHQLCTPVLDRLGQLPQPQRNALGTAFGLIAGHVADRFFVGLATLTLLAEAADEQPMLCVIDDAQWLDVASAQALAFVARRLDAHSVGMVFAIREPSQELKGLPELVVEGLSDDDARELLCSVIAGPLDPRVLERIVVEAGGNPLALVELARALSPAELDRAVEMKLDSEDRAQRALIRVALADDEVLLREGLAGLLERAGLEVVGQSGNAHELIELVRQHRPELVVVDIRMPPTHSTEGLEAARLIREEFPQTAIMILSAHVEVEHAMDLLAAGGSSGYLLKSRVTDVEEFIDALERIVKGGSVIDPVLVRELVAAKRVDDPLDEISPREREVLSLVAQGRSNAGIAKQLWVTEGTVEKHVHSILGKLSLPKTEDDHRRVLAVLAFLDTR
jgi:DNA-binding NarL/FixJ family response regulator